MAAIARPPPNGFLPTPPSDSIDKVAEYEKILRIRDEIFAGSHPRLTVPAHLVVRRVSPPRLPQVPPIPVQTRAEQLPPAVDQSNVKVPGLQLNSNDAQPPPTNATMPRGSKPLPNPQAPQPTASGIDPIFLTKSDDLVRAEIQLQRQRLEKQLREQFVSQKSEARHKPHAEEVQPGVTVASLLPKVMEIMKSPAPAKPTTPNGRVSPSDSFDENSFYSSRAPDSTPEEGALSESPPSKHQVQPRVLNDLDADGLVDQRTTRPQQVAVIDSPYRVNTRVPYPARQDHAVQHGADTVDLTTMDLDEDDEPEYSPPEPVEQYPPPSNNQSSQYDYRDPRSRPLRRYSGADQHDKRPGSPLQDNMRIVRNHITSPLAPQPSRVSPLAVAKAPALSQNPRSRKNRNQQNGGQIETFRPSPTYDQPPEARKKRKLEKKKTKRRNGNMADGSEPYIKDEPVSPPPFHDVQPLGSLKPRAAAVNKPVYIDDEPVRELQYVPTRDHYFEPPQRHVVYDEPPMPRSEPRSYSRASMRPPMRDDQDLRRVASMHNMRVEQPEYVDAQYDSPLRARAPSYAVVESPTRPPSTKYHGEPAREERIIRSPAPVYRESEREILYEPIAPPPQKRLIEDQFGNRFYEIIQPARSSAPRPVYREDVGDYNESAYARNRATSMAVEPPPQRRYMDDMPPPQASYRRITEVPRTPVVGTRQMAREPESGHMTRSASVQVMDYPTRQPVYVDDRMQMREPVRMASVRPGARYEEVQQMPPPRMTGVRPSGREGSVFVDDGRQPRMSYVPVQQEQPVYRRVVQDGQVYEVRERY